MFSKSAYLSLTSSMSSLKKLWMSELELSLMGQFVFLNYHSMRGVMIYLISSLKAAKWSALNPKPVQLLKILLTSLILASKRLPHPMNRISR